MSVLQRKAHAGTLDHQARSMTVPKALRIGLAKTANEILGMALVVIGATQQRCQSEEIADMIDDQDLLILLDGPNGAVGGAVLGTALVTSLVQQQTTGRVMPPSEEGRTLTATDASLCAPIIDGLFQRANALLDLDEDRLILGLFKFGVRSKNKRLLQLALEDPGYHRIRLTVDVAAGLVQSHIDLLLPVISEKQDLAEYDPSEAIPNPAPVTLESTVMGLKTDLSAILCSVRVPLSRIGKLARGDVLSVPAQAFDNVSIVGQQGKRICSGALGQIDGMRAFMIANPGAQESHYLEGYSEAATPIEADRMPFAAQRDAVMPEPEIVTPENLTISETLNPTELPNLPDLDTVSSGIDDPDPDGLPQIPDLEDLPELGGLPELDESPNFDDMPKLNIA